MKKNKSKKFWYIQNWGTYSNQTPIFVGYSADEITKELKNKRFEIKKDVIETWQSDIESTRKVMSDSNTGAVWFKDGLSLLWLPDFKDDWKHLETIIHECFHLVIGILGREKMMVNFSSNTIEEEAMAYQHEFLFRSIRRKLQEKYR